MSELLNIKGLKASYGVIKAVKGIDLSIQKGQIVTLIGANGAGKTSTLNSIIGLVHSKSGSVKYGGAEIMGLPPDKIVRKGIALSPEGRKIFPNLTVKENLFLGAYSRSDETAIKKDYEWVLTLFPRLKERLGQAGGTLSGGEQQMLAIGRALMSDPDLLMLDEPSLGLAPLLVRDVFDVIKKIREDGKTVLLVEQNAAAALATADYAYVLESGSVTLEGEGRKLLETDSVRKAYLGVSA